MADDPDYEDEALGDDTQQCLDFEDIEDEDGLLRRPKRARKNKASPVQRLRQRLGLPLREHCESWGITLPDGFEQDKDRMAALTVRIDEVKQELLARPDKTTNTYQPLQESIVPLIKAWQESGRLKCSYQPSTEANAIAPAAFYEVDGDAMLALVKELVQGQKVDELLKNADIEAELAAAMKQQQQEDEAAAAAGSPAAGHASSGRSAAAAGSGSINPGL